MYEIGPAFWSKAIFMAELLIAESITVIGLKRRPYFVLRAAAAVLICLGASLAMPLIDGALYASFMFVTLFVVTLAAGKLCFDESFRTILFCGLAGYATQHIAFELFDIVMVLMGISGVSAPVAVGSNPLATFVTVVYGSGNVRVGNAFVFVMYGAVYFVTYFVAAHVLSRRMNDIGNMQLKNSAALIIIALTVAFDIVISAIVTEYGGNNFNKVYILLLDSTNVFCCMLALYQQFSLAKMRRMSDDLEVVERMWAQSKQQYDSTRANIDLINMKCHDLKHQVRTIGRQNALNPVAVGEIERIIDMYDSGVQTGNEALDTILTEKSLYCNRNDISLGCMADGKALGFIAETDLYSLFGNLIDNAIEAVDKLDPDRRVVGVSVKRVNSFVYVNVHNYYDGELVFDGDLPKTTKADTAYHGYGMKSVKLLVEKYGGDLKVRADGGVFNVDILFN